MSRSFAMPNLPGYMPRNARGVTQKTQNFVFVNGYRAEKVRTPASNGNNRQQATMKTKPVSVFRPGQSEMPRWLKHEKMVLSFDAYFKEAVHEVPGENFRIRKCTIAYYLADETMSVTEIKVENSGMPQGTFINRTKVPFKDPKTGVKRRVLPPDLVVGGNITLYSRTLHISGCNGATREYMGSIGINMLPNEVVKDDAYTSSKLSKKKGDEYYGMKKSEIKEFVEASMGKTMSDLNLKQFIENDGMVLRFYGQWDDTGVMYGSYHDFTIHFFLADDTVEILEVHEKNSGAAEFPRLLNRQKLPIGQDGLLDLGVRPKDLKCYGWKDLSIGATIRIFGRDIQLLDCDPATRRFYESKNIMLGPSLRKKKRQEAEVEEREPPPHNGYGTYEDSLGSCNSLMPKPPKKDWKKMFDNQRTNLKFSGKLRSNSAADKMRKFVITFFLADDTISIFEPQNRNSGIVGGKFLKRQKLRNSRGEYIKPQDFYVGSEVSLAGFNFLVDDIDEFSLKHMENNQGSFPMANIEIILRKLISKLQSADLSATFQSFDADSSGFITMSELEALLNQYFTSSELTKQEVLTIMRYFDKDKSGKIDYSEFVNTVQNPEFASGGETFQSVDEKQTQISVNHFHTVIKKNEPKAKLLQMFRVKDDQLTGNLQSDVVFSLLRDVAGLAEADSKLVMDFYFGGMKEVSYSQFHDMVFAGNQ